METAEALRIIEALATFSICESTKTPEGEKAMNKWVGDIIRVSKLFGDFLGGCLMIFAEQHFGLQSYSSEEEIPEPPDLVEVTVPYFVKGEMSKAKSK